MNSFGNIFRLTGFGESHGAAIGGVIEGLPAWHRFSLAEVAHEVERRAPGRSLLASQRREPDKVEFLSGLMALDVESGELSALASDTDIVVALGTPVGFFVRNSDVRSADYDAMRHLCRPSHADYAWNARYGIRDWRGGGRSSGRETLSRVVAGAFARQILSSQGITVNARIVSLGGVSDPSDDMIAEMITSARDARDSVGGTVECTISGIPAGIGEPVFGKLDQMLVGAMLSIGAVKGVEFGMGFAGCNRYGSEVSDSFDVDSCGHPVCPENYSGGIQGGISNGMPIVMRVAVKPTPTIPQPLHGISDTGELVTFKPHGRHDPCILPRVLPVIEAMAAMTIVDAICLRNASDGKRFLI